MLPRPGARRPPSLIVAGATHAGAEALHGVLSRYPDVALSGGGEYQDARAADGPDADGRRWRGAIIPTTCLLAGAAGRLRALSPDARLVFVLRNPVDRAWAHYCSVVLGRRPRHRERRPFRAAFLDDVGRLPDADRVAADHYYLGGCYHRLLAPFIEAFGPGRVLVLGAESLSREPEGALRRIGAFLDLAGPPPPCADAGAVAPRRPATPGWAAWLRRGFGGASGPPPELPASERPWLAAFYRNEVAALRRRTGEAFSDWTADFPTVERGARVVSLAARAGGRRAANA